LPASAPAPSRRVCLALAAAAWLAGCSPRQGSAQRSLDITGASYGQDFRLTDPQGRERTLADFRGKVVLLFFGFVQCPDVCPAAMARAAEVLALLGDDGSKVQGLFVTVDPERDTPEVLQAYTAAFHPSFIALRGDLVRTKETAEHFKVFYRKVPTAGSYTMDHTAISYAFDAEGKLRLAFRPEMSAREVADDVAVLLKSVPAAASR
jgi:protein SCO1/2